MTAGQRSHRVCHRRFEAAESRIEPHRTAPPWAAGRQENERLSLVVQAICATGIRVSERKFITAEAVDCGRAEVDNKGKRRVVFLPEKLRRLLKQCLQKQKRPPGAVFTTRTGKPLDRSNIWRDMKALCESAGVEPSTPGRWSAWA